MTISQISRVDISPRCGLLFLMQCWQFISARLGEKFSSLRILGKSSRRETIQTWLPNQTLAFFGVIKGPIWAKQKTSLVHKSATLSAKSCSLRNYPAENIPEASSAYRKLPLASSLESLAAFMHLKFEIKSLYNLIGKYCYVYTLEITLKNHDKKRNIKQICSKDKLPEYRWYYVLPSGLSDTN